MTPCMWEVRWVFSHPQYYADLEHQVNVANNIVNRYRRNAIIKLLRKLGGSNGIKRIRSYSGVT